MVLNLWRDGLLFRAVIFKMLNIQNLNNFKVPQDFRGKSVFVVQLWWICSKIFINGSPQFMYGFRRLILRLFGAKIGKGVLIRPSVEITYPWKINIGNYSWIGDNVVLYSLGNIYIGSNSVVSQKSYLCSADHDMNSYSFEIRSFDIKIGDKVWVASDCFVGPGVSIGNGCVIGARSTVFENQPEMYLCYGYPCKPQRLREFNSIN